MESKHLEFNEVSVKRKTKVFEVVSKHDKSFLGCVEWWPGWRQYVFSPDQGKTTIWSHDCLLDLSNFIKELMNQRKEVKQ
jgi:hypothetical protein